METTESLMEGATSRFCKHRPRELKYLGLYSTDRREQYCDDREVSELFPEEFLCECEDDIGIVLRYFCVRKPEKDKSDKYEEEQYEKYHRPERRTTRSVCGIFRLLCEIHRDIPSIVEKYRYKCSLDKSRKTE